MLGGKGFSELWIVVDERGCGAPASQPRFTLSLAPLLLPLPPRLPRPPRPKTLPAPARLQVGLNGIDNGAIRFTNVRVPRENLLDRFATGGWVLVGAGGCWWVLVGAGSGGCSVCVLGGCRGRQKERLIARRGDADVRCCIDAAACA